MKYFSVADIELVHMQIVDASGGSQGVRDRRRIEAAVATQRQEVFGVELYKTIFEKAAALCRGIIADHPFVDGNKRTGVVTALLFLELNNYVTKLTELELADFAVQIAVEHLDVKTIAQWLQQHSQEVKK